MTNTNKDDIEIDLVDVFEEMETKDLVKAVRILLKLLNTRDDRLFEYMTVMQKDPPAA